MATRPEKRPGPMAGVRVEGVWYIRLKCNNEGCEARVLLPGSEAQAGYGAVWSRVRLAPSEFPRTGRDHIVCPHCRQLLQPEATP